MRRPSPSGRAKAGSNGSDGAALPAVLSVPMTHLSVCAIDDRSTFLRREMIGIDTIHLERGTPQADATGPAADQRDPGAF